jgi:DNA repair exonuclease SbcCD ATPase subunit
MGVSISDQDRKSRRRRLNRPTGASDRDNKKRLKRPTGHRNCERWSGGKSERKNSNGPRRSKSVPKKDGDGSHRSKRERVEEKEDGDEKSPDNAAGPDAAFLTESVNVVSLLAETHRKLEAEKAEVDSLRAFSTGLLLNLPAFANAAYAQGFAAGCASLAGQDFEARNRQIEELQREVTTARKAAAINSRQIKSDGKQIAELQAQLEKSRDEIERIKLERDEAKKKAAEYIDYFNRTRNKYFRLRDYTRELDGLMESIEEAGQWQKHFAKFEPDLRAKFVRLYELATDKMQGI